jgi:uncharacterized Tic20 family protein
VIEVNEMEDRPLNSRILRTAAICHLLGLTWLPNTIGIFWILELIWRVNSGGNLNLFFAVLYTVPAAGLLLSALLAVILWQFTKRIHPFIAESGRRAVNFTCSCSLYLAVACLLMVGMWFLPNWIDSQIAVSIGMMAMGLYVFLCPVILLVHFCSSAIGVLFALRGKIYSYRMSLQLFKDVS